ncbi:IniB N-terminal domain-containing protein [Amycolatopsis pigmentata]|uniref:IniB N-terminal domain-containing protein n=1 Tax=Amycolatopsis pigmentata TaxID=450801 RepID=A0ABW5FLK6_9PSEU
MSPVQTLHDFALNLLSDPAALTEFNTDPQGVLNAAGLGDVSPADVHEILPLVMDTAPASLTDALGNFASGDPAATFNEIVAKGAGAGASVVDQVTHAAAGPLSNLPNLSGVFGGVSDFTDQTGITAVADDAVADVSGVVHQVTTPLDNLPLVGPLLNAADIDLQNTSGAIHEHAADGKFVGATVDAATNHLGDALLWKTAVDVTGQIPGIGAPVSGLIEEVRHDGGGLLGVTNEAIGSTPVGVHSGEALAGEFHSGSDAGLTNGPLDHVAAALPVAPAIPALPVHGVPALGDAVGSLTNEVHSATGHLPVAGGVADHALGSVTGQLSDIHQQVAGHAGGVMSGVDNATHGLNIGNLPAAHELHDVAGPLADDLHLGF